ncbi:MAG: protein adenylyltransferase SelO [Wenzhouxiangellaceae bacterium]
MNNDPAGNPIDVAATSYTGNAPFEGIAFDNSYARLPEHFHARMAPRPVARPRLIRLNDALAESLGLDPAALASEAGVEMLAGNRSAAGADPLAMVYAGHQFGNFVPQLGDGRALLLGEVVDARGVRHDIHLKGAGATPFSRGGDGRSSIGPVVREYLASEAMAALGISTTRALAAIDTGEAVYRQQPEPGGILVRVAQSHVRVGTFEYFARRGDIDAVRALADYVIARHYPELADADRPYQDLFAAVITRTARLVSSWMLVGFIHGVMNTDNTSIAGETIDYGPFGFIDAFDPATVYSSIDRGGRYAWNRQPAIAQWNLARLGECLLPLFDDEEKAAIERANGLLGTFTDHYSQHFNTGLAAKIGLAEQRDGDTELGLDLLERMHRNRADFTLTFRRLGRAAGDDGRGDGPVREQFADPESFDEWAAAWRRRLAAESRASARPAAMDAVNPAFILRNHLAQQAVDAAIAEQDFGPMRRLAAVLARPFDDQPGNEEYARPPRPDEQVLETFCGT